MIDSINFGDSGFLVLRKMDNKFEEVFHSEDLIHGFNIPYQIGTNGDDIKKFKHLSHVLFPGDIIVLASDGLWDNVFPEEIIKIIKEYFQETSSERCLNKLAEKLALIAQENSNNT